MVFITENSNNKKFSICQVKVKVTLWPTVSQPGCLFVLPRLLHVLKWGLLFDERRWYDIHSIYNTASNNSSIVACVFVAAGTCLPRHCLAAARERVYDMDRIENTLSNSSAVACVFVAAGTCLPSRSLVAARKLFTELLPSNVRGDTKAHREQGDLISLRLFFYFIQNMGIRLTRIFVLPFKYHKKSSVIMADFSTKNWTRDFPNTKYYKC
jgi:hypothetical protein